MSRRIWAVHHRRLGAAIAVSLGLLQCAPCDPPNAPLQLIVGTGGSDDPSTFAVLRDGVSVALTQGFQGGQHVWIQVRGINSCQSAPSINVTLRRPDRSVISFAVNNGNTWNAIDPTTRASEWLAVQASPNDVCRFFNGGSIIAEVHVTERSGRRVDAEFSLIGMGWTPSTSSAFRESFARCCADFSSTRCYPNGPPTPTEDSGVIARDTPGD